MARDCTPPAGAGVGGRCVAVADPGPGAGTASQPYSRRSRSQKQDSPTCHPWAPHPVNPARCWAPWVVWAGVLGP